MKSTKRILSIIAIVSVLVGLILISASIVMVNGNFKLLSTIAPYQEKSFSHIMDGINKITLNSSDSNVNIVKSDDNEIHIKYFEREKEYYTINVSNKGELLIDLTNNMKWYDYIGIDFSDRGIFEIAVPDNMVCDYSIKTSNGDIVLSHIMTNGSIVSTTSNGEISATSIFATTMSMHSNNGKIILTNLVSEKNIDAETSNGKIEINNISVGTSLKLKSSNGEIAGNINDSIENFNITSHTSNGKNNLPESRKGGIKDLDVKTSNGNIDIIFND